MQRRRFLRTTLGSLAFATLSGRAALVLAQCQTRTEPNIEGPFYLPNAPATETLADTAHLSIRGVVRDTHCRPMEDAVMEFWQADPEGEYDRQGYRFRGQLRTNTAGQYQLHTVRPGRYLNGGTYRPAHIHVKVHASGRPPLTTQLYFPLDPYNADDPWFRSSLLISLPPLGCGQGRRATRRAGFNFVV